MSHRAPAAPRRALTLIEMLIALAVTLVMMAAVVNLFANVSGSIRNRRAVIEVSSQLRQVRQRLAGDLAGATCPPIPTQRPGNNAGYIEILEGPWNDKNPSVLLDDNIGNGDLDYATSLVPSAGDPLVPVPHSSSGYIPSPEPRIGAVTNGGALGDWDDILALTVRSETTPFVAQVNGRRVESTLAEVIWFAVENPADDPATPAVDESGGREPGMRQIYRRVLLIAPWLGPWDNQRPFNVSVRREVGSTGPRWVANTLSDLTKRESRFEHDYDLNDPDRDYPHELDKEDVRRDSSTTEFLMLDDVLAFDVRVYDPGAPCYEPLTGTVVEPCDIGWYNAVPTAPIRRFGAYVDLGWNVVPWTAGTPRFDWTTLPLNPPTPKPRFGYVDVNRNVIDNMLVYDAWSDHYESDGINTDVNTPGAQAWQTSTVDQGRNGLDDDGVNGVDDAGEREAPPPYETPLRGMQVKLRLYERDARQIREASVTHSFVQ